MHNYEEDMWDIYSDGQDMQNFVMQNVEEAIQKNRESILEACRAIAFIYENVQKHGQAACYDIVEKDILRRMKTPFVVDLNRLLIFGADDRCIYIAEIITNYCYVNSVDVVAIVIWYFYLVCFEELSILLQTDSEGALATQKNITEIMQRIFKIIPGEYHQEFIEAMKNNVR